MVTPSATRAVAVKIEPDLKDRVKRLAAARNRSPHWLMHEAIVQFVDREERQESFRQAGLAAWQEYQATGMHVTFEEADAWLARLESGADEEPPECHV